MVGLLRYHVKSMVTNDDDGDRQVDSVKNSVGTILLGGFHPQHPRIANLEENGCSPIVDNVR